MSITLNNPAHSVGLLDDAWLTREGEWIQDIYTVVWVKFRDEITYVVSMDQIAGWADWILIFLQDGNDIHSLAQGIALG